MRPSGRANNELRKIKLTRKYTCHAEGSVLVEYGNTVVLCNASIEDTIPRFLKGAGKGWVTAEYGMLPRATSTRTAREAARGKQTGRTMEIQRLIARSLRAVVNLSKLGENTITVDCDVLQADGGTRTAAITGGCVALIDALNKLLEKGAIKEDPFVQLTASASVGLVSGEVVLDLDYPEDSKAETDMNVVMTEKGDFVELQGTAEGEPLSKQHLTDMIELAQQGILRIFSIQQAALGW